MNYDSIRALVSFIKKFLYDSIFLYKPRPPFKYFDGEFSQMGGFSRLPTSESSYYIDSEYTQFTILCFLVKKSLM